MTGPDPQATRTKSSTHRQPGVLVLCLSLFSLVTVKRHRGCDCHLCRQSVRLPKANQSSLLCSFPGSISHLLRPPAPHPPQAGAGGGGSAEAEWGPETAEPAGVGGQEAKEDGPCAPLRDPDRSQLPCVSGRPLSSSRVPALSRGQEAGRARQARTCCTSTDVTTGGSACQAH